MDTTTWAVLDAANVADGHYKRWPGFYVRAREREEVARAARDAALDAWIDARELQPDALARLWLEFQGADEEYAQACAAFTAAYCHWQTLLGWLDEPCSCLPNGDACRHCRAAARLNDWDYEPGVQHV